MIDRLVVVDDEIELARFVARVGESVGYDVRMASRIRNFKDIVIQWDPTVIILDLAMPEMDGLELLRWLSSQNCTSKIVIMSGFDTRTLEAAKRIGQERGLNISNTISKPVRVQELKEALTVLKQIKTQPLDKADIKRGLAEDEFFLLYQPKVALKAATLYGTEALLYWNHPEHGVLSPDLFIGLAEETGLIDDLADFVLVNAIHQQKIWMAEPCDLSMAINLSPGNLRNETLADRIAALCSAEHVPTDRLILEVTESTAMYSSLEVLDTLTRLRIKGFSLAIDDFGTGFSSLARLQRLPVTEIKIDRSFTNEMSTSSGSQIIVKTIIDLAHNMGLMAVAEGIETVEQYKLLVELGCDLGQGHGISKPLAANEFQPWAASWHAPIQQPTNTAQ